MNITLRLLGQQADGFVRLHYNVFRDYDPTTGRYVQSDPIGLQGGINTYSYVGGSPVANTDPTGLFTGAVHNDITTAAVAIAASDCPNLPTDVANADWLPESQAPRNAHWHAMRDGTNPAATVESAKRDFDSFVVGQSKACTCLGLARALHAIQDSFARGHAGFKAWSGGVPTPAHVYYDDFPSKQDRASAVQASVDAIRQFRKECDQQCPK